MATKRQRPEADGAMQSDDRKDESSLPVKVLKTTVDLLKPMDDKHIPPKTEESDQKATDAGAALQESPPDTLDPEEILLSALEQEMAEYDAALHSSAADVKAGKFTVIGNVALHHVLEDDDYDESEEE